MFAQCPSEFSTVVLYLPEGIFTLISTAIQVVTIQVPETPGTMLLLQEIMPTVITVTPVHATSIPQEATGI